MTVVPFQGEVVPALREPRESVITALEEALEAARSGHLQGVVMASFYADTTADWRMAGIVNSFTLVGAATCMLDALIEEARS